MVSCHKVIKQGLIFGFAVGLMATVFDSLYMVVAERFAPLSYPVQLVFLNVLVWTSLGFLCSLFFFFFAVKRKNSVQNEPFYRCLFFLLPVTLLYGVSGRLYFPMGNWFMDQAPVSFDRNLSVVWALAIVVFALFYSKKQSARDYFPAMLFIPEITAVMFFFHFCSNLPHYKLLIWFFICVKNILHLPVSNTALPAVLYITGVPVVFVLYYVAFTLCNKRILKGKYLSVWLLFVLTLLFLTGCFAYNFQKYHSLDLNIPAKTTHFQGRKVSQILFIVMDTVRADRLSIYGGPNKTSNLEQFSKDSLVFENCIASSSWTVPSHASMFTGLYPVEHGSHGKPGTGKLNIVGDPIHNPLSEDFHTLAERFRDAGYKTGAVSSNVLFIKQNGLTQGFQAVDLSWNIGNIYQTFPFRPLIHFFSRITGITPKHHKFYRSADDINTAGMKMLSQFGRDPFFLFMNYLDAHEQYSPPRPFLANFCAEPFPQLYSLKLFWNRTKKSMEQEEWVNHQLALYDAEVAYLDQQLGDLFESLKAEGLYDSSLIIVTSDHGELFRGHGYTAHRGPLYNGSIHVPLIIKFPQKEKIGLKSERINLCDLFPTILSICGLPVPEDISASPFGRDAEQTVSEFYGFETGKHRALYENNYKYMKYEKNKLSELYDIVVDPEEKDNLIDRYPNLAEAMENKLSDWETKHLPRYDLPKEKDSAGEKVNLEALKALGYIQ